MKYELLEDVATADIAFRAFGKTLNALFENCAIATTDSMVDISEVKAKIVKEIELSDGGKEDLLFSFLSEIVYLKDAENLFFSKFEVNVKDKQLKAKMCGEKFNDRITFRNDVKAVTMHMLKINKLKEGYDATVVLDI